MRRFKNYKMSTQHARTAVGNRGVRRSGLWALVLGVLVAALMPQAVLAEPRHPVPPGARGEFCRINKIFYADGTINPENDCQWCQSALNRLGWTDLAAGSACGSDAVTECTNADTCDGAGVCLPNDEPTTTTCGDAGTECTNQDYCDGHGGCADNGFVAVGSACGSDAATECTNPDTCDGAGNCLANDEPTTTTCGDTGTECTNQDYCDGHGGCTDNGFVAAGSACGSDALTDCTNPDTCDGAGACLANDEPTTMTCGDAGTECTNQDYCDGHGGCADNGFVAAGSACGSDALTDCTNPDTCDGAGTCLANDEPTTTTCGDAGTECTNQDYCDGHGSCADSGFVASGTACGSDAATDCTNPDTCDGAGNCLANDEPTTTTCGDTEQPCRFQDYCDGHGSCEDKGFKPASTACGDPTSNECDIADHCSGTNNTCVSAVEPAGTLCGNAGGPCTNHDVCDGQGGCTFGGYKDASTHCTGTANGGSCDDDAADHCDGNGACVDAFQPSTHVCDSDTDPVTGAYLCKEALYCSGTSSLCPNQDPNIILIRVYDPTRICRPSGAPCDPPEYCDDYESCSPNTLWTIGQTCPGAGPCEKPYTCDISGNCVSNGPVFDATCVGEGHTGNRPGEWCDIYAEVVLGQPQCGDQGQCVRTVCKAETDCENAWTCDQSGQCVSGGFKPSGQDCIGDYGCVKYSCDGNGNCVDQALGSCLTDADCDVTQHQICVEGYCRTTRAASASCRSPANECDVRDRCGDPSVVNKCNVSGTACTSDGDCPAGDHCVLDSFGRTDFSNYPDCGPDQSQPFNTPCTYDLFGQDAPGQCINGTCNPVYCKNSIECPDGWVCACPAGQYCETPYCIPAPTKGGYGDVCSAPGHCNKYAESPGLACTTREQCDPANIRPDAKCLQSVCDYNSGEREGVGCESSAADCQNATHPFGTCVLDSRGTCGQIPGSSIDYVCCNGMAGDGIGGLPGLGQTGRCQECCGNGGVLDENCSNLNQPGGTRDFFCCDGKCTDINHDIHNCGACNYDGTGFDCTNRTTACAPTVIKCDAYNYGDGCILSDYCAATAQQNGWTAAACYIPEVQVPVAACDYCTFPSWTPGTPCLTDAECGGFPGSCYHDQSLFCAADRQYAYTTAPECLVAPYSGCTPTCCELEDTANVGSECDSDANCFGGTRCVTSCDLTPNAEGWYLSPFCFSNPTCQYLGGVAPELGCVEVPWP